MYQFPPEPWRSNTLQSVEFQLACLFVAMGVICFLLRRKRKPLLWDAAFFMLIGLVLSMTYVFRNQSIRGRPNAHFLFLFITWSMVAGATVLSWMRLAKGKKHADIGYSILAIFLTLSAFVYFLFPPLTTPREARWRTQCKNNLKQIGLALHNYHDIHERFPSHQTGEPPHSWRVDMLPFLDQTSLYNEYNFAEKWNLGSNEKIAKTKLPVYQCPSDPFMTDVDGFPFTAYAALVGTETIWQSKESLRIRDITDGTSNTLLVVEACGQRIPWAEPKDVQLSQTELMMNAQGKELGRSESALSSFHIGGIQALMGDGSVRFLSETMDKNALKALITASGDEEFSDF